MPISESYTSGARSYYSANRLEMNGFKLKISLLGLLAALATGAGACNHKPWIIGPPPPPPPPPAPAPVATPKPPPPAPPPPPPAPKSCKTLDDKCEAKADTELAIGDGAAKFHPPSGWTYAEESGGPVAAEPGAEAMMGFSIASTSWPQDTGKAIDKLLDRFEIKKLVRSALKTRLGAHAQTKVDADGLEVQLWEVDKASQFGQAPEVNDKPSSVLAIVAKLPDNTAVVGVAWVLKPGGEDQVPAIMTAVKSLKSGK